MGMYLATGIVQKIVIYKKQIKYQDITVDIIIQQLKKELDLNFYYFNENIEEYCWTIKPKMLEENLIEFLDTQFQVYTDKKDSDMQKVIAKLTETKSFNQIIELASSKSLAHFQLLEEIFRYIKVVRTNGFSEHVEVIYSLISYFLDGKIIMECYGNILRYFEGNIRLQRNKYSIVDCVKVMITS